MNSKLPMANSKPRLKRMQIVRRAALLLVALFLILVVAGLFASKDHIRSLWSFRRVPETNMYVMDYYGGYNIAGLYAHGTDVDDIPGSLIRNFYPKWLVPFAEAIGGHVKGKRTWQAPDHACSSVSFRSSNGQVWLGRNFDWMHDPCLILRVHGRGGPSSVAVLDLHYLQLDQEKLEHLSLANRLRLLLAPYLVFDGMNEWGVAISIMQVREGKAPFDPSKPSLVKPVLERMVLDRAHNADEAVALLRRFNIDFDGAFCHFMIADASGKSVIVEFIDGRMETVSSPERWQVCTNHPVAGKSDQENRAKCPRFKKSSEQLAELGSQVEKDQLWQVLSSISVENWTMWTSLYNLTTGEFEVAWRRKYDRPYADRLEIIKQ